MTLEARYACPDCAYPLTLLDADTGHVFGHATSFEAMRALVRLVRGDEVLRTPIACGSWEAPK